METYQRAHVIVDDHFARFGQKSYAVNKITSVDVRENVKTSSGWLIFAIVAALLILMGLAEIGGENPGNSAGFLIFGLILAIPSVLMFRKRVSRTYQLLLATAAGEVQATQSNDGEAIQELRNAIEARIAAH